MPWDQSRPVPWKRLLMFEGIYIGLFAGFILLVQRDQFAGAAASIGFAVVLTTIVLYALIKFGYHPNWLRSRAELAEIRAEKIAVRQAAKAEKSGRKAGTVTREVVRERPPPTRRTSTGATNRQRRTRATRKR